MTKPTPIWRHQPVCTDDYIYIGSDSIVKVDVWLATFNTRFGIVRVIHGTRWHNYIEYTLRKSNRDAAGVWRAAAWRVYDAYVSSDMQPDDL